MPENTNRRCDACGCDMGDPTPPEEMAAEFAQNFPEEELKNCAVVCDDCYAKSLAWRKKAIEDGRDPRLRSECGEIAAIEPSAKEAAIYAEFEKQRTEIIRAIAQVFMVPTSALPEAGRDGDGEGERGKESR